MSVSSLCVHLYIYMRMCVGTQMCIFRCLSLYVCVWMQVCVRVWVCTFAVVSVCFSACIHDCLFCVCLCVYVYVYTSARLPQHQCVQQGVTPCQHSNSLTILLYPQVKQQAAKKLKKLKKKKKLVPVYQPNNTSRLQHLNKPQHCVNKQ